MRESLFIALDSLRAHKLRAFLTLLGIVIGVATVIAVVSIISGMNRYVVGTLSSMGTDNFTVSRIGIVTSREAFFEKNRRPRITLAEEEEVERLCGTCREVGAQVVRQGRVRHDRESIDDSYVIGITANMDDFSDWSLETGRALSEVEVDHRGNVCLLGADVAEHLFPALDPLGRRVRSAGHEFTVIGVIGRQGTFLGQSLDNFLLIPITTFQKLFGTDLSIDIHVKAPGRERISSTQDEVRTILRAIRETPASQEDDFDILTSGMLVDLYESFTGVAFLVMIGISSISLLVGGIVIMNIMLVSVTERTREIGLRKAIGAKRRDILNQFLAESVTLSFIGGLAGIGIGAALAKVVAHFSPLPAAIEPWSILAGVLISSAVGVFFGIFPALRAARMNPIDALRAD